MKMGGVRVMHRYDSQRAAPTRRVKHPGGDTTQGTLQGFVTVRAASGAIDYSDDAGDYAGILCHHSVVCHSAGEYERGDVSTNSIEGFFGIVKRVHIES